MKDKSFRKKQERTRNSVPELISNLPEMAQLNHRLMWAQNVIFLTYFRVSALPPLTEKVLGAQLFAVMVAV